jgi:hypothetical protein
MILPHAAMLEIAVSQVVRDVDEAKTVTSKH